MTTSTTDRKSYLTWQAEYARRGYSLSRTHPEDGPVTYMVTRWNLCRELRSLDAVAAFARQVGAAQ